jgi:dihydroorotase
MILKNGIVLLEGELHKLDIRIQNGIITGIGEDILPEAEEEIVSCESVIIAPAFVDLHTHLRVGQEYKEDPKQTIRKAIRGGYCAINCMPNTEPAINCSPMVEYIRSLTEPNGFSVYATGAITSPNGTLTEIETMAEAGAVALSDDGHWTDNSFIFYQALKYARKNNLLVIDHAQDTTLFRTGRIYEGIVSYETGLKGFPKAAEALAIYRDGTLNLDVGANLHVTHLSTMLGLETISCLKQLGTTVTCDVTPHHLLFDETSYKEYDTNLKANPPFGDERDKKALIHGLRSGEIPVIATDHAPHSIPEKDQEWEDAPYGIASIDNAFEALYEGLVVTKLVSLERLLDAMSTKPANVLGIDHAVGVGKIANLVLIKENVPHTIQSSDGAMNNPYIGKTSSAKIVGLVLSGNWVLNSAEQNI